MILPPLGNADLGSNPTFNVLIAYEDFETGKQAKRTYDSLAENLGRDCQFSNQMWKFDVLTIPKLEEIAVKDCATADIVIISCHGDSLPNHVRKWLETGLAQAGNALALVALFMPRPETEEAVRETRGYLAGVAARSRVEFFAQPDDRSVSPPPKPAPARSWHAGADDKTLALLAGAVQQDHYTPRWGINE
jgi:hypothetical protein